MAPTTMGDCCMPAGCLAAQEPMVIYDVVKVACNNEHCNISGLMHRSCFESWETAVLVYLRSCGRARSWSERQRQQNLWTKKGYDLAFKACGCVCGRGHLRKDLDWIAPKRTEHLTEGEGRKKNRNNLKKSLTNSGCPSTSASSPASAACKVNNNSTAAHLLNGLRYRANSLSSTGSASSGSSSPPELVQSSASIGTSLFFKRRANSNINGLDAERERHGSGNCGLFAHRADFSSFNALPRHKLNSYHIKMEDEGSYGNDDIRCFILSNLATARMPRAFCLMCQNAMIIYDRYPLIDGTFFLSPKQYSKSCIPVTVEGRQQHLSAVCMSCLEGWTCSLRCRSCRTPWDGSSLILGTMYSYDVFAAVPCCPDRLRCNQCSGLVVNPDHRYPFFSQYSRDLACPHCSTNQHHFIKSLPSVFQLFRSPPHSPH